MVEYVNIKLPASFKERFERLNEEYDLGYASFPELIKEAVRERFEEIEAHYGGQE